MQSDIEGTATHDSRRSRNSTLLVYIVLGLANSLSGFGSQNGAQGSAATPSPSATQSGSDPQAIALAAVQKAAAIGDQSLLRSFLRDTDPTVQTAAFDALATQDSTAAVGDLLEVLRDLSAPNRSQTLQLLDHSPQAEEQTVRAALRDATNDPGASFGQYAAQALARREHPGETASSGEGLQGNDLPFDADSQPRNEAPLSPDGKDTLQTSPQDGSSSSSQDDSMVNPGPESSASLVDLSAQFHDTSLPASSRLKALERLDQFNPADEMSVTPILGDALSDEVSSLRAYAVQALAKRGTPSAITVLRDVLHGKGDPLLRLLVVQSLGQSEAGIPLIREALSDSDKRVSGAAADLLRQAAASALAIQNP